MSLRTVRPVLLEHGSIHAELVEPTLREAHRGLSTLLHHVAELARENELAFARHERGLDEQDVAADGSPGEARRNAGHARAQLHLVLEVARPQDAVHVVGVDRDALGCALGDLHRGVAQQRTDLALEIAHAGFPRVTLDDGAQGRLADRSLLLREAIGFQLPRDEISRRDRELLVLRVAG
jgi:hypothetical protein